MDWASFEKHLRHLPPFERVYIREAYELAERLHAGQTRKSGGPYFTHPVRVAQTLADMGADSDSIIVALLHDAVEDTPLTITEVGAQFGPAVQQLIDGLTKFSAQDLAQRPTVDEQVETLRKMFTLAGTDIRITVIKLADRLDNVRTIEGLPGDRQGEYARETLDVHVKFAHKLSMAAVRDEMEAHCLHALEPETFAALAELRRQALEEAPALIAAVRGSLGDSAADCRFEHEFADWGKQRAQREMGGAAATGLPTRTMAVVCPSIERCYALLGSLHQRWRREVHSFQDYINHPVSNGYRALQTTLLLEDGTRLQCKIRTEEMHAYARQGIALYCFDSNARDPLEYLPWLHRIAPLSEDTKDRSREFWDGLQSDILGDSILVYGPDGGSVSLPAGSTALDAAVHLRPEESMRLTRMRVNGLERPLRTRVKHGDSLSFDLSDAPTVDRDWLGWVETSFAAASIRTGLLQVQSEDQRAETGRRMLQQVLHEAKRGFLEEFEEAALAPGLARAGYASLRELCIGIADGHVDALDAYIHVFDSRRRGGKEACILTFTADPGQGEVFEYVAALEENRESFREIRHRYRPASGGSVRARMLLTAQEQADVQAELRARGARDVRLRRDGPRIILGVAVCGILLLWGADPIVAGSLLRAWFAPGALTFLRFAAVFLAAAAVYGIFSARSRNLKPLNPFKPQLLLAGVSLFCTAYLTYSALERLDPTQYILFILIGQIGLMLADAAQARRPTGALAGFLCAALAALGMVLAVGNPDTQGMLLATGASLSFALYSRLSDRYQSERIHTRFPAYIFWISAVALVCSLPFGAAALRADPRALLAAAGFALAFTFLPYLLYFECLRRIGRSQTDRLLPLTGLVTFLGDAVIGGHAQPMRLVAFLLLSAALYRLVTRKA